MDGDPEEPEPQIESRRRDRSEHSSTTLSTRWGLTIGQSMIAYEEPEPRFNSAKRTGGCLAVHNRALTGPTPQRISISGTWPGPQALFAFALTRRPERCGVTPRLIHCFHLGVNVRLESSSESNIRHRTSCAARRPCLFPSHSEPPRMGLFDFLIRLFFGKRPSPAEDGSPPSNRPTSAPSASGPPPRGLAEIVDPQCHPRCQILTVCLFSARLGIGSGQFLDLSPGRGRRAARSLWTPRVPHAGAIGRLARHAIGPLAWLVHRFSDNFPRP